MKNVTAEMRPKSLPVPQSNTPHAVIEIPTPSHLIIVGANGAGKSRFAASIEASLRNRGQTVLRISAQRAVSIPTETRLRALDDAIREVVSGNSYLIEQGGGFGRANRTDQEQNLGRVLSDFEAVLGLLFARTAKVYKDHYRDGGEKRVTPIQRLSSSWTSLLPERELIFNEEKMSIDVMVKASGAQFHTSRMSDGERTVLYLLSQCLSAEVGSVIIIDEPELHIHRSVVNALFSNLQLDRPDCLFVYITHDLEFAAGQSNATKIWLKSFLNNSWDWTLVPEDEALPERLLLEVLGARKPVLFVEGGTSSDDRKVYDILFPKMNVIPCGSCDQVIKAVGVLRQNGSLTHMTAFGLVDRDFRSDAEINNLSQKGVYTLQVAEVESLFVVEEVIDILSSEFSSGSDRKVKAKENIVTTFIEQISRQVADGATFSIRSQLDGIGRPSSDGKNDFEHNFTQHIASIDPGKIYEETQNRFFAARESRKIRDILKVFNMKKLRFKVGTALGVQPDVYLEKTMSMLQDSKSNLMRKTFEKYMPTELSEFMGD
jgi:Protein of unknown function (DUF4435)/AAA domain, putative AbiEii toxin, Type IV TA system